MKGMTAGCYDGQPGSTAEEYRALIEAGAWPGNMRRGRGEDYVMVWWSRDAVKAAPDGPVRYALSFDKANTILSARATGRET